MLRYALNIRCANIKRFGWQNFTSPPLSPWESRKVELISFMKRELQESDASSSFARKYLHKISRMDSSSRKNKNVVMKNEERSVGNRLLATFQMENIGTDEQGDFKPLETDSGGYKGSLMDLLNDDNFGKDNDHRDDAESLWTKGNNAITISRDPSDSNKNSSLLDLLDTDYSIGNTTSKSSEDSVENQQGRSLLDLLDDDNSMNISEDKRSPSTSNKKSLMDLLDQDFFATEESSKTSNQQQHLTTKDIGVSLPSTLMDLLEDDSFGVDSRNDFKNRSLMDILKDDDYASDPKEERIEFGKSKSKQRMSLMDLLHDDICGKGNPSPILGAVLNPNGAENIHPEPSEKYLINSNTNDIKKREEEVVESNLAEECIDELIRGSSTNKLTMSTPDYNTLLLYISTFAPDHDERVKYLVQVYAQMLELGKSGIKNVCPDHNTFSILITILSQSKLSRGIAQELCSHVTSHIMSKDEDQISRRIHLDHDLLLACMKILVRQRKLEEAERLITYALDKKESDIHVRLVVFRSIIELYKTVDKQRKALELIRLCLNKESCSRASEDEMNSFLQTVISWPRKNRQGKRVSVTRYYTDLIDILLDTQSSGYSFPQRIWKSLLDTSIVLAKLESESNWLFAEKCCSALLRDPTTTVSPTFLESGLEISQKVKNPEIIHRIIEKMNQDSIKSGTSVTRVPIDIYMKAIQLCIDTRKPHLADLILRRAMRSDMPPSIISSMYTMVMTGYVQIGDSEKTEEMFHQIDTLGLSKSESAYAVYINSLNLSNKYGEALDLLRSMSEASLATTSNSSASCYSACILNALQRNQFQDVFEIEKMMKNANIPHNSTTLQGVVIAKANLGDVESLRRTIYEALESQTPMNYATFESCLKFLLPQLCDLHHFDVPSIRSELRHIAEKNESISSEAMALNRSLMDCLREQNRVPSNIKSEQRIALLQHESWRNALKNALTLSAKL